MYLKSTDPTTDPCEIEDAFDALYPGIAQAVFEHDQWWVYASESGEHWSVHDAVGDPDRVCNGYCFEELG